MKREPSTFSHIKVLDIGYSVSLPVAKSYAAQCAVSYLEAEYGREFNISQSPDGEMIIITRTS